MISVSHSQALEKIIYMHNNKPMKSSRKNVAESCNNFFLISGAKTGKDNGFSILFDIESYDYGYYDEGSEGLKVAVVHHLDMPIIRQVGIISRVGQGGGEGHQFLAVYLQTHNKSLLKLLYS